ncbi:MAG: DUF4424 domain-containing protein, partial [Caulobacteraceae bacterium]
MLDLDDRPCREGLGPVEARLQHPGRRHVAFPALALVILVGPGEAQFHRLGLVGLAQPVERLGRLGPVRRQRHLVGLQPRGAVDIADERLLLDLSLDRLAVDQGVELQEIGGVVAGQAVVALEEALTADVGHREGDHGADRRRRGVLEAVADHHLLLADVEVLGPHLDAVGLLQHQPAGAALANDSTAELAAGGLVLKKTDSIEMRSEDLYISQKEVVVRYR